MYILSGYLSLGANNGNQNHYCFLYTRLICFTIINRISFTQDMALAQNITAYFNQLYCLIHTISITTQLVPHTRELQSKKNIPDLIKKINGPKRPNKRTESNSRLADKKSDHESMIIWII